jgi:hypothetical protein
MYGSAVLVAPSPVIYGLRVDWDGDGTYGNPYSDVMQYLLAMDADRGRMSNANPLYGRAEAGKYTITLDNRSGLFSSLNSSSPLFGNIVDNRALYFETVYGRRWTAFISRIIPDRINNDPVVKIEASGPFVQFATTIINPAPDPGSLEGVIIGEVLDAAGWPAGARVIDAGQSTTSPWFEAAIDAMTAMRRLEETGLGFLSEDEFGRVVYQDRAYRRSGARLFSQATYSDTPAWPYPYIDIDQSDPVYYIVNSVTATATPYVVQSLQVLWTMDPTTPPSIAPGQTLTFIANYPSPGAPSILTIGGVNVQGVYVGAWTTPVSGTDYTVSGVSLSDLAVTVQKFATSMPISIKNNHSTNTASITLLQARGTPVTKGTVTSVTSIDGPRTTPGTSQYKYGVKTYLLPALWLQNTAGAQAYADFIIAANKDPRALLDLKFRADISPAMLAEIMTRRISDRVTVVAGEDRNPLGINGDFFVERIVDHYDVQHNRYEVTLSLSQVGPESSASYWILGTSTLDTDTFLGF